MTEPQEQLTPDQMANLNAVRDQFNRDFTALREKNPAQSFGDALRATWENLRAQKDLPNISAKAAADAIGFGDL